MPFLPAWHTREIDGLRCEVIDWCEHFRNELHRDARAIDEMRGFCVVFSLRVERNGSLICFSEGACVVRRNGCLVVDDREPHPMGRRELAVLAGDRLDIAHFHWRGGWLWAACLKPTSPTKATNLAVLEPYRLAVCEALEHPNGPPLKIYTNAAQPFRCAVSLYSMILNGYQPSAVHIFGEYQWNGLRRRAMETLFPFATIVSQKHVDTSLVGLDARLCALARRLPLAMKLCISLFIPPLDFCYADDDVVILEPVSDALELHSKCELVYAPDRDYGEAYQKIWCPERLTPLPTGDFNGGLYFMRNDARLHEQAQALLTVSPDQYSPWTWEQGFYAWQFAGARTASLPTQRYFYPVHDGLPGGLRGYDWDGNPCRFVSVHFGGPTQKPTDDDARALANEILGRYR